MTRKIDWNDAPAFLAVVRTGSLTGAAPRLGTGVATVSRRIDRLEQALGVRLFIRHQTGYRLTDDGHDLLPDAEAIEDAMGRFKADAGETDRVSGHVRLATAENLADLILIPGFAPFLTRHPGLSVEILTDVSTVNLHRREADLAVRLVRPDRGRVSVRQIGTMGSGLYGSTDYVTRRTQPPDAPAFDQDKFIGWADHLSHLPAARWLDRLIQGRQPRLRTTTLAAQVSAVSSGMGLAILPHFVANDAGLTEVPTTFDFTQPIWLAIHEDLAASARVRAVADHLVHTIGEQSGRLSGQDSH